MRKKRLPALLLACALLLVPLPGCGGQPAGILSPAQGEIGGRNTDYFTDIWRGDMAYADMAYEHYEAAWFDAYTKPIYALAEKGGSEEDFADADYDLVDHLYYVYTLQNLIDLRYSDDPTDEYARTEREYTQDLYYDLNDEYWAALHALAVSPNASLLSKDYADWQIKQFTDYEAAGDDDKALYSRENELVAQYYTLSAAADPDWNAIADLFAELVKVRNDTAKLYGYDSYAAYSYDYTYSKDYTPEDAKAVWQGAKTWFVPLVEQYADGVYERTDALYGADAVDCSPSAILEAMGRVLPQISSELYDSWKYLKDYGLYDIGQSDKKMQAGFTTELYYWNEPFIFNCPDGSYHDYTDMFHEFGHFTNAFYVQSDLLFGVGDNDLAELQSQGMEMMFTPYYDEIFGAGNGSAVRDGELLNMVYSVVDGAMYDEFQQRVYAEPDLTGARACEIFRELYAEYGYTPYDGYEHEWMSISHNFEYPFYYISYAVSALAALEIFGTLQTDPEKAVDDYLTVEAMDGESCYFSEALSDAGLADVFDAATYKNVAGVLDAAFSG